MAAGTEDPREAASRCVRRTAQREGGRHGHAGEGRSTRRSSRAASRRCTARSRSTREREFHFETGRALAERLGYRSAELDRIPAEAIDSFAGVGYYFDLAELDPGETVVDLGSGSGMDSFLAARQVGAGGRVIGIDMTDAQLDKATALAGAQPVRARSSSARPTSSEPCPSTDAASTS